MTHTTTPAPTTPTITLTIPEYEALTDQLNATRGLLDVATDQLARITTTLNGHANHA